MKINMNARVRVHLTPFGVSVLSTYEADKTYLLRGFGYRDERWKETGYNPSTQIFETELWNLMQIFGPHFRAGSDVPFEKNIMEIIDAN